MSSAYRDGTEKLPEVEALHVPETISNETGRPMVYKPNPRLLELDEVLKELLWTIERKVPALKDRRVNIQLERDCFSEEVRVWLFVMCGIGRNCQHAKDYVRVSYLEMLAGYNYDWLNRLRDGLIELAERLCLKTAPLTVVADAYEVPGDD